MADPTQDKTNHAVQGVDIYKHNSHAKMPHGIVPHDQDPAEPFLSQILDEGEYHSSNTPNGCSYGEISGKYDVPEYKMQGPQMGGFGMFFFGAGRKDWEGNRSGE